MNAAPERKFNCCLSLQEEEFLGLQGQTYQALFIEFDVQYRQL